MFVTPPPPRRAGFFAVSDRCIHQLLYTTRINGLLPLAVDLLDNDTVARDRGKPFAIVLVALPLPLPLPPNPRRKDARLWKLTLHSLVCVVLCGDSYSPVWRWWFVEPTSTLRFCFFTCYRLIPHIFNAVVRKHTMHTTGKQFLFVFSSFCFICAFSSTVEIVYIADKIFLDLEPIFVMK